jgi:hypothetical protein
MNRRKFVFTLCGASIGSSAILGSSAFSRNSISREVNVRTVSDDNAYLQIHPSSKYSNITSEGILSIQLDEYRTNVDGEGIGTNSIYEMWDSDGLFKIENQGDRPVGVYSTDSAESGIEVSIIDMDSHTVREESTPIEVSVGQEVAFGIKIEVHEVNTGKYNESVVIHADSEIV